MHIRIKIYRYLIFIEISYSKNIVVQNISWYDVLVIIGYATMSNSNNGFHFISHTPLQLNTRCVMEVSYQ